MAKQVFYTDLVAAKSTIEWTDSTWNPVTGCTQLSPGCDHCYALTFAERFRGVPNHPYAQGFDLRLWPERLDLPMQWKRPRRIFVNSMSDLFHEAIPDEFILQVFEAMASADWHVFQVLTKRPRRMANMASRLPWPAHVWAGTSVELDRYAWRANACLRRVPAAVRFVSAEPLLGPLPSLELDHLGWVITGGESGPNHRACDPSWVRDLRDRCVETGVAFFHKQWGGLRPKAGGRLLDGRSWDEMPMAGRSPAGSVGVSAAVIGREVSGREIGVPPRKDPKLWPAAPHTIAKVAILRSYLYAWFQIMGRARTKRGQDLLYVDGFAGPGEYTNHPEGSPIAALAVATAAISASGTSWVAGQIHCAFIEVRPDRIEHLSSRIAPFRAAPGISIHELKAEFVDGLKQLRQDHPASFSRWPLFVFIDPFGAKGVPFATVAEILASPCSEILINFDADGIARILRAEERANHEALLDEVFGDDAWRTRIPSPADFGIQCRHALNLYLEKLRRLPRVKYVFPFEMQSSAGLVNYFLIFASQHPLGLEKMKEAMRSIDKTGEYRFCDAHAGQGRLFRFDAPSEYSALLAERFVGRRASYDEMNDVALNETPFTNPKSMLKDLESKNLIRVASTDTKRRRGTFNEKTLLYVEFPQSGLQLS